MRPCQNRCKDAAKLTHAAKRGSACNLCDYSALFSSEEPTVVSSPEEPMVVSSPDSVAVSVSVSRSVDSM